MADKYNEKQDTNMTNSERFPVPPFPHQRQPFPGLAGKMQPRPIMVKKVIREAVALLTEKC